MVNSTITATYMTSGQYAGKVRITVNIGIGDPVSWGAYVQSKQDHGQGMGGFGGDYPYYVEDFHGSDTQTVYKTYSPGNYVVELALQGMGPIDYSLFDIPGGGGGGGTSYDCINRNCLLRQDTQGFFSDYSTCNRVCEVKSVDFQVVGNGQMNVSVNGVSTVIVFPGETKSVTLRKGNQLEIILIAYVGNHLVGLCDVPQTECRTSLYYNDTISDANALFSKMVATFAVDTVIPTKYNCVSNQCQGPYTSGTYNSLAECQAVCKPPTATKYNCVSGTCQGPFVTGTYNSLVECQTACTVEATKYNCVSGTCQGPYTSGTYNSLSACQAACTITQKWKCINPATNTCAQTSDGTFDTEAQCKAATSCQPSGVQTWYCNTSTKVCSLQAGSGGYATKALCDAACSGGGGGEEDPCLACDKDTQYCLFGTCYKKNDVYMVAGAAVLLMVLTRK